MATAGVRVDTRVDDLFTKFEAAAERELAALRADAADYVVVTGMYRVDGTVYKVVPVRDESHYYAKRLGLDGFEYAPGAMRVIGPEHRMSLSEAQEYGRLTGRCCVCAKLLTDPESIANGIGPVCATRV